MFRCIFPPFRKITFRVRASGTFDSAVTWLSCIDTSGIVATPGPFKHLDVSKYADRSKQLVVPVLDKVSDDIRTGHRMRYLYAEYSSVVSLVVQRVIEIISRKFALKVEQLKCIKNVECECCVRPIKR